MKRFSRFAIPLAALAALSACSDNERLTAPTPVQDQAMSSLMLPPGGTVVVRPGAMNGWYFWNDKDDTFAGSPGELVSGPVAAPLGTGSVRLGPLTDVGTTSAGHSTIATDAYIGTRLDAITALAYATYQSGPTLAIAVQFDVKYRPTDVSYGGRLVYEPYYNNGGTVGAGWQSWSAGSGKWWASKTTAAGSNGNCAQPTPCTLPEILALFPDAIMSGRLLLKAGSNWSGFDGNADALSITIAGTSTTFDFEPTLQCTVTCYVNAAGGSDANGGTSIADAKKTIQAALNTVSANGTVRVLPGAYDETAPNSMPTTIASTYQFGLFFASSKPGITLMGVTAADAEITNAAATLATITTNATNNFGYSGIFVEAANTTIQGVKIGANLPDDDKTIEVVADNFTLRYSATNVTGGGAVYLSEFTPSSAVTSYHITDNLFADGTQIAISSGAGQSGAVAGREILRNTWTMGGATFPAISFNGAGGVPWFAKPVGGAVIKLNNFSGGSLQYIRARGAYTEGEFAWKSYWDDNTYDKGTVTLVSEVPFDVRTFSYMSGTYEFTKVRRIGTTVQGEIDLTAANDIVLAKAGTYPETVVVPRALTLKGAGIGSTVLQGTGGAGTGITVNASNVSIKDLTAQGYNYGMQVPTGPLANLAVTDVATINNTTHGIWVQAFQLSNASFTRVTSSGNNAVGPAASGRGIWIINGDKSNVSITGGTFANNRLVGIDISDGTVTGVTISGNTVTGNGDSGIGVLGAQGPGANLVSGNIVTNNGRYGIEIKVPNGSGATSGTGSIVVSNNIVSRTLAATDARDYAGIAVFRRSGTSANADQPTGVIVTGNTVSGFVRKVGGTGDGFGIVVEGTKYQVAKNEVSGNDVGIQVQAGNTADVQSTPYFDRGNASASGLTFINRNSLTSNAIDVRNVGAVLTDATCNWYGATSGPVGAKIVGSLTTYPFLATNNLDGTCAADTQGPITTLTPPAPAPVNTAIALAVNISDLTTGNSALQSYTWTRDGGTPVTVPFASSAVTQSFTLSVPADAAADVDNICVRGTDIYGNVGAQVCVLTVWYDPSAGFVTGGGWINSPAGAYPATPSLAGKANFGFVSKYEKGKTTPSGNTEFQFNAADLNFKATLMDWLIVAGARAQFKGAGTLNGVSGYTFMLTAIDGAENGGGGTDKFRIKILNSSGVVVYDNNMGASDDANPTTVIGGGNVIIHK